MSKGWHRTCEDLITKDGDKIPEYRLVFNTTSKELAERVECIFKAIMDEKCVSDSNKPPLGLVPMNIYHAQMRRERMSDILDAMTRYRDSGLKIPVEWAEELAGLVSLIKKDK